MVDCCALKSCYWLTLATSSYLNDVVQSCNVGFEDDHPETIPPSCFGAPCKRWAWWSMLQLRNACNQCIKLKKQWLSNKIDQWHLVVCVILIRVTMATFPVDFFLFKVWGRNKSGEGIVVKASGSDFFQSFETRHLLRNVQHWSRLTGHCHMCSQPFEKLTCFSSFVKLFC